MKTFIVMGLVSLVATSPLTKCDKDPKILSNGDACEVIKKTLYPDCQFKFSSAETSALSEENQIKLTSVKLFFRNCPQAKACLNAKK